MKIRCWHVGYDDSVESIGQIDPYRNLERILHVLGPA